MPNTQYVSRRRGRWWLISMATEGPGTGSGTHCTEEAREVHVPHKSGKDKDLVLVQGSSAL